MSSLPARAIHWLLASSAPLGQSSWPSQSSLRSIHLPGAVKAVSRLSRQDTLTSVLRGGVGRGTVAPPASLRTAARLWQLVLIARAVLLAVTHRARLSQGELAQAGGALRRLVRSVSALRDSVTPEDLRQAEVVVTPPTAGWAETVVGVVLVAETEREGGGGDVWTAELLLALLAVPHSVTYLSRADTGAQAAPTMAVSHNVKQCN